MSDELRLSEELAACEARLAALPPAASRVNRDELMYRAGWAAREAALVTTPPWKEQPSTVAGGGRAQGGSPLFSRGGIPWRSHAVAAALAASLAATVTFSVVSSHRPRSPDQIPDTPVPLATAEREASAPAPRRTLDAEMLLARWDRRGALSAGSPLWAPRPRNVELTSTDSEVEEASPPRQPATARRLLDEMTPRNETNRPAAGWPWKSLIEGNAI